MAQVAETRVGPRRELGQADGNDRERNHPGHKVRPSAGGKQTDRHAEKTGEKHQVGEKGQE